MDTNPPEFVTDQSMAFVKDEVDMPGQKRRDILMKIKKNPELNNIRLQLNDQLKCLDGRLDVQQGIISEVQDIFRRRAEIELNYSKELEKLAKAITNRHKEHKQKRDGWQLFSSMGVWEQIVAQTKRASRDHSALADIYASHVAQRCVNISDDLGRMYKKCRDIGYEIHEEVLKVLHELHTAMKTHHSYQSEFRQAETKLQVAEKQRAKLMAQVPIEKREKHKKLRLIEKEYQKRKQKYDDSRLKATKARNEYMLCLDSANASIQKYFVDDLSDLIDCMDFGFHQSLYRAVMMHNSGLDQVRRSLQVDIDNMNKALAGLDSRLDKQRFFEFNNTAFMIPKKFEYTPVRRDDTETVVHKSIMEELECRKSKLKERLTALRTESEEIWKSMETAEKSLTDIVAANDFDTTRFFVECDKNANREPESIVQKQKMDRMDIEDFYTNKFRDYVLNSNRMSRLQAKYDHIRVTQGDQTSHPSDGNLTLTRRQNTSRRRRIGRTPRQHGGQPKLFGGSLEEYLEETNQDIPTIIKSCVRVINLYGLHHHGIFRVSGSQVEINNFRDTFERGDDPLADMTDASDINSVAGVFKLYLRELREPLFPTIYFDQFMELAQLESKHEFVVKVRDLVKTWPRATFIVLRYIFAFLNHLSEYSDENMMDPYNLAICFGPTLVPIPEERDQVQFQNLVNELIKNFIIFHEDIFPENIPGPTYEKYQTMEPDDMGDSPIENSVDDLESEITEDDSVFRESSERDDFRDLSLDLFGKSEVLEAQALYDFSARSVREVNFSKGDIIILYKQVSYDWWKGSVNGKEGLIPDKYIMLKIRGEDDRERLESCRSIEDALSVRERPESSARERFDSSPRTSVESRSRASSSSDAPHHISSHPSPSPVTRRRSRPSSTSAATASSCGGIGSTSSPTSSPGSLRASRTSVTSSKSIPSQKKISPKSMSTPTTPPVTSTVITLSGRRSSATSSITTTAETKSADVHPLPESKAMVANTHIIRVSGPVAKVDEIANTSEAHAPRSRVPVSPSLERELVEVPESSGSQDSIASTGSNKELKTKLDSTIAEVEALAQQLEKQKTSPSSDNAPHKKLSETGQPTAPKPTLRRSTSGNSGVEAHPQPQPRPQPRTSKPEDAKPLTDEAKVFLRQSSWASREQLPAQDSASDTRRESASSLPGNRHFAQNRNMWERRTSQGTSGDNATSGHDDNGNAVRGGFRSNREFWEQRVTMRQKQTPDLVLDLPVSTLSTSPGTSTTSAASRASPTGAASSLPAPVPKPRPRHSMDNSRNFENPKSGSTPPSGDEDVTDQFAKADRNTLRKSRQEKDTEIVTVRRNVIQGKGKVTSNAESQK